MKLGENPDTTLRIQWSSVIRNQLSLKWRRRPPTGVVTLSGLVGLEGVWVWVEALLVPFSLFELVLVVRSEHSARPLAAIGGGALSKKLGVSMPPRPPGLL